VYPKGSKIKSWVTRLSKGDRVCWEYWIVFQNTRLDKWKRKNDNPKINALISVTSLLAIIVFVALMPKPV
ncbi:MAG: hypothetical protein V3U20_00465, partial [Thermoplasmata archaeon]